MTDQPSFKQWAIIELFGHQRIAGLVTEQSVGGCSFVRVDVPETKKAPAFTKLYGNGAIYGISFVTEDVARAAAQSIRSEPVSVYDIQALRQQALPVGGDSDDEEISF